jgi:hypothetical protein
MSERSSIHYTNSLIPSADQLNTPAREGAADMAHIFEKLAMSGATVPANGAVFGGLEVQGKVNDMRVDVTEGVGWLYDAAVPSPQHPFELIMVREDDTSAALNDGDGTHPRIDVISITPSSALLDTEPMLQIGGGTTPTPTRRGPDYTINVTEGTPAASPVAPSTPSGAMKLAEVLVPAGLTAGGGGTSAATITDYRTRAGLEIKGPESPLNGWVQHFDDWTPAGVATLLQAFGVRDADGKVMAYGVDRVNHWPAIFRAGIPAGDVSGNLYPMLIPGGRTWWDTKPGSTINVPEGVVADPDITVRNDGMELLTWVGCYIEHDSGAAHGPQYLTMAWQVEGRSLRVEDAYVSHKVLTVLGGAGSIKARLYHYDQSADTSTLISDDTTLSNTAANHDDQLTNVVPTLAAPGDVIAIRLEINFAAVADGAIVNIKSGRVQWREGSA